MEWPPIGKEKLIFRVTKIWPLNPKAIDGKNRPNQMYATKPNNGLNQKDYNSQDLNEENAQLDHKSITIQLLNLRATNKIAKFEVPIKDQDKLGHWYYFDMSKSLNAI